MLSRGVGDTVGSQMGWGTKVQSGGVGDTGEQSGGVWGSGGRSGGVGDTSTVRWKT